MPPATRGAVAPQAKAVSAESIWARLPLAGKALALLGAGLIVVGIARGAVSGREGKRGLDCPETVAVDDETAGFSFGSGEVDVQCGGKVIFGFQVPPKTR